MICRCPTAHGMPPSAWRCRGAATCWWRWRRAKARRPEFSASRWTSLHRATWRAGWRPRWMGIEACLTSPRKRLSDSHILKPQRGAIFDALEVVETLAHDSRAWLSVVSGPPAETTNDPGRKGERTSGVRVFLPFCLAFELRRYGFEDRLVGWIEGIGEALAGGTVASFNELHYSDGGYGSGGDELDHDLRIANVGRLDIEACSLERVEELFNRPAHPIEINDPARLAKVCDRMRRQEPPVDRFAILGRRRLADIDHGQGDRGR